MLPSLSHPHPIQCLGTSISLSQKLDATLGEGKKTYWLIASSQHLLERQLLTETKFCYKKKEEVIFVHLEFGLQFIQLYNV